MIIAREKKKTNIAEYIIYMWQVEDIIRAHNFDLDKIEEHIIQKFEQPETVREEIKDWYANLIIMMKEEGITRKGHLQFIVNNIDELNELHLKFISSPAEAKYKNIYREARNNIEELRLRLNDKTSNDIHICFMGLYALLLMRLRNQIITEDTTIAMKTFSNLLAYLAAKYRDIENGKEMDY